MTSQMWKLMGWAKRYAPVERVGTAAGLHEAEQVPRETVSHAHGAIHSLCFTSTEWQKPNPTIHKGKGALHPHITACSRSVVPGRVNTPSPPSTKPVESFHATSHQSVGGKVGANTLRGRGATEGRNCTTYSGLDLVSSGAPSSSNSYNTQGHSPASAP